MIHSDRILIAGQGLAGTSVAWHLHTRGVPFLIVDPDEAQTSSKVAAGLVTPVTGMRLNLSWRVAELIPAALQYYRKLEADLGVAFYHETPQVRLFKSEREEQIWAKRSADPLLTPWLKPGPLDVDGSCFHAERGGFEQRPAGWLDTAVYLAASKRAFIQSGSWQQGRVQEAELEIGTGEVLWRGGRFSHIVLCRGWEESRSERLFPWLRFDAAKGAILDLETAVEDRRIFNRGAWLLPRPDGSWRAGSTYEFDFSKPLSASVEEVKLKLAGLLKVPFQITGAQEGIRPIIKRIPGVVGRHPAHDRVLVLNGLGSKGVLRAPDFARRLVEQLLDGKPMDAEVDVRSLD